MVWRLRMCTLGDLGLKTEANGAQSSRVPVPLPDDPYVAVRHAHLVDTDTESDPEEASSEVDESHPLGSRVPLMGKEFEASEPSGSYFSPSSFRKRYRSSYKTPSPSSSLTLSVQKRYRGTSELILDTDSEGDELGEEDTEEDESLDADNKRKGQGLDDVGLGYGVARRRAFELTEEIAPNTYEVGHSSRVYTNISTYAPPATHVQTPPSPEWSLGSLPISPSSLIVSSSIASPVATLAATIDVD
uniref:Uncharacterized protein n=1 Tax=Tanacetum cinerariifolium TaxID=118510 RepID=A0A6L2P6F0_TANCI|nr:hypothetical protein [Tanacetum cinerariifolium]